MLATVLIYALTAMPALHAEAVAWSGYLQTDDRISQHDPYYFSWQEYRLGLSAGTKPSDRIGFYSEIWLRSFGFPAAATANDLRPGGAVSSYDLDLREAYLDLSGVLFKNLDLRFGRQRIALGTADRLNPTDNLNPDDLEDMWDFGRHMSSNCVKASYCVKNIVLTGVYVPVFTPAILPQSGWSSTLMPAFELPPGLTAGSMYDSIILPPRNPGQSSIYGLKVEKNIFNYDVSFSYVYGRDDLPIAKKVRFLPMAPGIVDIASELVFPRMQVSGFDFAGEALGLGIWGEGAVFFPEQVTMTMDMSALGMGVIDTIVLPDDPYIKFVLGADYTFKNGIYLNCQYLHGFLHERGAANLEDYLMIGLEWKLFDEKLNLKPVNGGIEVKEFNNIKETYAVILSPEIVYSPLDNAQLSLGAHFIEGRSVTTFGRAKDNDDVYFKLKYSF
jgi:hypothetical protein